MMFCTSQFSPLKDLSGNPLTIDSRLSVSCEMAESKLAIPEGLTSESINGVVKKAAAMIAKYTIYTSKILDPDEVLWVASLDSCCVFVAVSLKLRVSYSSIAP